MHAAMHMHALCDLYAPLTLHLLCIIPGHAVSRHAHGQSCHPRVLPRHNQSLQVGYESCCNATCCLQPLCVSLAVRVTLCNYCLGQAICTQFVHCLTKVTAIGCCGVHVYCKSTYRLDYSIAADLQKACSLPWKATFKHPRLLRTVQLTWSITW